MWNISIVSEVLIGVATCTKGYGWVVTRKQQMSNRKDISKPEDGRNLNGYMNGYMNYEVRRKSSEIMNKHVAATH